MSFGFSVGDFITIAQVSKLAWDTFTAIKNAPKEWRALESEVQSLAISLKSLDDADTTLSIVQYTKNNPQREQNLKDLLANSNNALAPMKALIEKYRVKDIDEKRDIRDWLAGTKFTFKTMSVQEFRNKLSLHTASLNIFLTTLTNTSLGRLEQLLLTAQAPTHPGLNLAAQGNTAKSPTNPPPPDDGFAGIWSAIGRDLSLSSGDRQALTQEILHHRDDIRNYVQFITSGGLPYSKHELSDRRRIRPQRSKLSPSYPDMVTPTSRMSSEVITYSLDVPTRGHRGDADAADDDELKALVGAMVSFDGSSMHSADSNFTDDDHHDDGDAASFANRSSRSRSVSPRPSRSDSPPPPALSTVRPGATPYYYLDETDDEPSPVAPTGTGIPSKESQATPQVRESGVPSRHSATSRTSPAHAHPPPPPQPRPQARSQSSHVRCDCCHRELRVGEMYLHCKICQGKGKQKQQGRKEGEEASGEVEESAGGGYDVCDPCWEKGRSCPGRHRDEKFFNHRQRRIVGE